MKSLTAAALLLTSAALHLSLATHCRAQGSLTPPGPPGPVMKTLDQIESRTPIGSAPFTISQGGSYYLTASLTVAAGNAITITADNVTLDLNGFTIKSTASPAAGTAIWLAGTAAATGNRDVTITNGAITGAVTADGTVFSGSGFANGIAYLNTAAPQMVEATNIKVRGVAGTALMLGPISRARACMVRTAGAFGIQATAVENCQAYESGNTAIQASTVESSTGYCIGTSLPYDGITASIRAVHCDGTATGSGRGLRAPIAIGCTGNSAISQGVFCEHIARDCTGYSNSGTGLESLEMATQCYGKSTSNSGLKAGEANSCTGYSAFSTGLKAENATFCYGGSGTNVANNIYALEVTGTASNCRGERNLGIPIKANVAIGCTSAFAAQKFLGTP